jgi:hypothetical protein
MISESNLIRKLTIQTWMQMAVVVLQLTALELAAAGC